MPVAGDERTGVFFPAGLDIAAETHIGGRAENQDAVWISSVNGHAGRGRLVAVADGMGGHRSGEIASRDACNALHEYYALRRHGERVHELARLLSDLVYRIDRRLRWRSLQDPALADMGTTLSCLVLTGRHSLIAHVGDSRIYRLRRGHLSCLTRDHTLVGDLVSEGELAPEEAGRHPLRHLLTQAVGAGEPLETVQTRIDRLQPGDRFLLCTDGLHTAVTTDGISAQLRRDVSAKQIAAGLAGDALRNGTRDNVTVVIVKTEQKKSGTT